jgi:hypothetical protein
MPYSNAAKRRQKRQQKRVNLIGQDQALSYKDRQNRVSSDNFAFEGKPKRRYPFQPQSDSDTDQIAESTPNFRRMDHSSQPTSRQFPALNAGIDESLTQTPAPSSKGTSAGQGSPLPMPGIDFPNQDDSPTSRLLPPGDPSTGTQSPTGSTESPVGRYGATRIYGDQKPKSPVTGKRVGVSEWGKPLTGAIPERLYDDVLSQDPEVTKELRSTIENTFGSVKDSSLVGMVNKVVNEGMPLDRAKNYFKRTGYGYSDIHQRAADQVAREFNPQENALERLIGRTRRQGQQEVEKIRNIAQDDIDAINREADYRMEQLKGINQQKVAEEQAFSALLDKRLGEVYGNLESKLQEGAEDTEKIYSDAKEEVKQAYDDAAKATVSASEEEKAALAEDAKRLGLSAGASPELEEIQQEAEDQSANIAQTSARAVENLSKWGADQEALAEGAVDDAAQLGAKRRADLAKEVAGNVHQLNTKLQRDVSEMLFNKMQNVSDIRSKAQQGVIDAVNRASEQIYEQQGKLADLQQIRGEALREAYNKVEEKDWSRNRQEKLDALSKELQRFNMQMKLREMGLQEQKFGFEKEKFEKQFGLEKEKLNLEKLNSAFERNISREKLDLKKLNSAFERQFKTDKFDWKKATDRFNMAMEEDNMALKKEKLRAEIRRLNAEVDKMTSQKDTIAAKLKREQAAEELAKIDPKFRRQENQRRGTTVNYGPGIDWRGRFGFGPPTGETFIPPENPVGQLPGEDSGGENLSGVSGLQAYTKRANLPDDYSTIVEDMYNVAKTKERAGNAHSVEEAFMAAVKQKAEENDLPEGISQKELIRGFNIMEGNF